MTIDLKLLHEKFFTDPSWGDMEELILEYLAPFRSVMNVDTKKTNDEIATEVRGRQLMLENLDRFLEDSKIITRRLNKNDNNYK